MPGTLFVCATPIGNLGDMTYRGVETLRGVSFIACEDTRRAKILCSHYDILTPLVSYHSHSSDRKASTILERIEAGEDGALISEAGTPGISDPGVPLVSEAHERGIRVVPIPGASAFVALAMAAGVPANRLLFVGFLSSKSGTRKNQLTALQETEPHVIAVYEAVHRIVRHIDDIVAVFGEECPIVVGRELTKTHEQIVSASASAIARMLSDGSMPEKGEFVIFIDNRGKK